VATVRRWRATFAAGGLAAPLEADIGAWTKQWNTDPKPFVWTKTAEEILESLAKYCRRISDARH
jgi:hypothetical protein